MSNKSLFIK